jgi:hypothetical protein
VSASRRKGTAWESAIVDYLTANGATQTERRALCGTADRGDIAGIPGLVIEAKNEKRVDLAGYVTEAECERVNDGARIGLAWVKRRGKTSPGDAYVVMTGANLVRLLVDAGYITETETTR